MKSSLLSRFRSRDLAALLLCASSSLTAVAEDSLSANLRLFNYRFSVERDVNPATADPGFAGAFAPALSTRSPQTITASKAMTLPEKRAGDLSEMLQTHEFSFGASALRTLGMDNLGSGSAESVTFKAVKLRASRSKVMLRAEFTFK